MQLIDDQAALMPADVIYLFLRLSLSDVCVDDVIALLTFSFLH